MPKRHLLSLEEQITLLEEIRLTQRRQLQKAYNQEIKHRSEIRRLQLIIEKMKRHRAEDKQVIDGLAYTLKTLHHIEMETEQ